MENEPKTNVAPRIRSSIGASLNMLIWIMALLAGLAKAERNIRDITMNAQKSIVVPHSATSLLVLLRLDL